MALSFFEYYIATDGYLLVVREDLGADIAPANTGKTSYSEASSKVAPAISRLKRIRCDGAARESLDTNNRDFVLESHSTVSREAESEDGDEASSGKAARDFSNTFNVAERSEFDKGTDKEESVSKTDFNTAEERGDTSAVGREVGEVRSNQGRGGYGSLEHANEGVAIDGLDDLRI